jgi:hypothetical protein
MKTFKDYLQEISLKTKANAYKKLKQNVRDKEDEAEDYYGPDEDDVKNARKRAANMAKSVRKSHPKGAAVVKGINKKADSGGYERKYETDPMVNKQKRLDDIDKHYGGRKTTKSGRYTKQTQRDLMRAQNKANS